MEIFQHPEYNTVIGKPSDMTDEQCAGLPARLWRNDEGLWATSWWKPNDEELAALNAGGSVGMNLRTGPRQHPVAFLNVYTAPVAQ